MYLSSVTRTSFTRSAIIKRTANTLDADTWRATHQRRVAPRAGRVPRMVGAAAAWSADRDSTGTRRGLQIALGLTWLLDAALQYQPFMFGNGFVTGVLAPAQTGNPRPVAAAPLAIGHLIAPNVPLWNAAFATIQLILAVGLLWRRTVRTALAGSIAWALAVWWLGEGLGGVLTGSASPVTGAPGAVILYAFLAVLVWPTRPADAADRTVAEGSPLGGRWSRLGWFVLWGSAAYLVLQPSNRMPKALSGTIAGLAAGEPSWLASLDRDVAATVGVNGTAVAVVIAVVAALAACGVVFRTGVRPALVLAVLAAVAFWVAGENFGGILTGQGTDPNTGPLLVLLAAAFWPPRRGRASSGGALQNSGLVGTSSRMADGQ